MGEAESPFRVGGRVSVLDHGFVRLDAAMADDLSVVNAARVSFGRRKEVFEADDAGLIRFLMRERHGTPFEHNSFRFHVRCPIFVAREWFRHRIGSFNEESARYHTLEPLFYLPSPEAVRRQVGKAGAYCFEPAPELAEVARGLMKGVYEEAYRAYQEMIEAGVARELARAVLPVGIYTQFYWTVNARSLMNFLSLRNSPQALYEMREYARAVEGFFQSLMPETHRAFVEFGRRAP